MNTLKQQLEEWASELFEQAEYGDRAEDPEAIYDMTLFMKKLSRRIEAYSEELKDE